MFMWNRAEAVMTLSKEYYLRVRAVLSQNQIKMQSKQVAIRDGETPARSLVGQPRNQYYIYVHKDDLRRANELIRQIGPEDQRIVPMLEW